MNHGDLSYTYAICTRLETDLDLNGYQVMLYLHIIITDIPIWEFTNIP